MENIGQIKTEHNYQNKLHVCLREFMEGNTATRASMLLYPLRDMQNNTFNSLLPLAQKLKLTRSCKVLSSITSKKQLRAMWYAYVLGVLYEDLYATLPKTGVKTKKKAIPQSRIKPADWEMIFAKTNNSLYKKTNNIIIHLLSSADFTGAVAGFYLHGSLATLDYEQGFSDFDSLAIIKKETLESPKKLLALRKKLLSAYARLHSIDQNQHHGIPVIAEQELTYYPEHYFPLNILIHSVPFISYTGSVSLRPDLTEKKIIFEKSKHYFAKVYGGSIRIKNAYQYKLFVSKFLLLPTLYLQAKNKPCSKKESFIKIKKELTDEHQRTLNHFNIVRKDWGHRKHFSLGKSNPFLQKIPGYLRRAPKQKLFREAHSFVQSLKIKVGP